MTVTIETFIAQVVERPMPQNPVSRIKILAKELAEGAVWELWSSGINVSYGTHPVSNRTGLWVANTENYIRRYLTARWQDVYPDLRTLVSTGYLSSQEATRTYVTLQKVAFDLLDEAEPARIFISYRRHESSAFALLVMTRLKAAGLEAFLDMQLEPGENWRDGLKRRVQESDYFILLLAPDTLTSTYIQDEIHWALEAKLTLVPIRHNKFSYKSDEWRDKVGETIDRAIADTHTIRVLEEHPLAYETALLELLNRFGINP